MKNWRKYIFLLFLLFFCSGWVFFVYYYQANSELKFQIQERDRIFKEQKGHDSALLLATKKYADTISKYISDKEFLIGDRKVSIEEIVSLFNKSLLDVSLLRDSVNYLTIQLENSKKTADYYKAELGRINDSFRVYKRISELASKNYGINYNIEKSDKGFILRSGEDSGDSIFINKRIVELIKRDLGVTYSVNKNSNGSFTFLRNPSEFDSILYYKQIFKLINNRYGISYSIRSNKDGGKYFIENENSVDSALALFPYFRHLLKIDTSKNQWIINMSGRELRKARRVN